MEFPEMKRVVVKVGTSTLTYENGRPHLRRIDQLVKVISDLKNSGRQVVLVSSGAIAVGVNRLGLAARPQETRGKQAAAAVGQCDLMSLYDRAFSEFGYVTAQLLLNRDVVDLPERKTNAVNTIEALLEMGAVPIINENDSISVEEILFGDNDNLSAIVAALCGAQGLVILTDIDGYYDRDPRTDPAARLVARVDRVSDEMLASAGGTGTNRGTGGMRTKLEAARYCMERDIAVAILAGDHPARLYDLFDGRAVGTVFCKGEANG